MLLLGHHSCCVAYLSEVQTTLGLARRQQHVVGEEEHLAHVVFLRLARAERGAERAETSAASLRLVGHHLQQRPCNTPTTTQ